jgi:hypothetical protein
LLFSMPVQNMKLAMAMVPSGSRRSGNASRCFLVSFPVVRVPFRARPFQEVSMSEQYHPRRTDTLSDIEVITPPPERRRVRVTREALSAGELVAYVVIIVMVCGPLAFGVFGF